MYNASVLAALSIATATVVLGLAGIPSLIAFTLMKLIVLGPSWPPSADIL